jgi:hypothetical protein
MFPALQFFSRQRLEQIELLLLYPLIGDQLLGITHRLSVTSFPPGSVDMVTPTLPLRT